MLVTILALSYFLSLLARLHWSFDLFSHFAIQYAAGGLILGLLFLFLKKWQLATLALVICAANLFEIYRHVEILQPAVSQRPDFTIVQYNRRYDLPDHDRFIAWAKKNAERFDVIVLQETTVPHVEASEELRPHYPYQIHEARRNAFGMVILSKHLIETYEFIPTRKYAIKNFILHFDVKLPGRETIAVYTVHPPPPTNKKLYNQRHSDLFTTAELLAKEEAPNIIMLGDWNLTPYSPVFEDLLEKTGLRYQITEPYPFPTWPWHFRLPVLQIPIDHVLSKGNLELMNKERGPAMRSDHYPVIASYRLTPSSR